MVDFFFIDRRFNKIINTFMVLTMIYNIVFLFSFQYINEEKTITKNVPIFTIKNIYAV